MESSQVQWLELISDSRIVTALRVSIVLLLGVLLARLIRRRLILRKLDPQRSMLLSRGASYAVLAAFSAWALKELGFELNAVLGAAGILTVALGFASQTSVSNIISGLFLIGERPFAIGDFITVNSFTGEVIAVDLLSVKIRTFDNLQVRVPNETLLKSTVTTLTRFPIRRVDIPVGVAYKEDIDTVRDVLLEVAAKNPLCLEEPKPLVNFVGFGDSSVDFNFCAWVKRENFLEVKNALATQIKVAFDSRGIEIPFPHRTIYTGSQCAPLPVRVVPAECNLQEE